MKSLVLLTALLLVGCSIEVVHETKNKFQTESQTESLSTSDKSKTVVVVNILNELTPETRHTVSDTPSTKRSTTIVEVVVPEPSPEVVNSLPTPRRPEPTIQISGYGSVPMEYPESDTRRVSSPRETPRQTTLQKVKTKRRPRNTEYTEGVLAFFRGEYGEAVAELKQAHQLQPNDPITLYFLGLAQYENGDKDEAEKTIIEAANLERLYGEADYYERMERIQGARRLWMRNIREEPLKRLQTFAPAT